MGNVQTAKLSVVDGQRRQVPPEMGQIAAHDGILYVLVEVSAPADTWDSASRQIVAKAINTFAASRVSETNALQAAAEAVNDMLLAQNQELPKEEHVWAGFNAAFIRDEHLYLAQAGPALTFIARGASVTRFPRSFDELQTSRMEALMPLGERPSIKCRLAHFELEPDDMITMAASHLPTLGMESTINESMQGETAEEVAESLYSLARHNDFSAYMIQFEPVQEVELTATIEDEEEAWGSEWVEAEDDEEAWEEAPPVPVLPKPATPDKETTITGHYRKMPEAQYEIPARELGRGRTGSRRAGRTASKRNNVTKQEELRAALVPYSEGLRTAGAQGVAAIRTVDWQGLLRRTVAAMIGVAVVLLGIVSAMVAWWKDHVAPRVSAMAPALDGVAYRGWQVGHRSWYAVTSVLRGVLPGDRPTRPRRHDVIPPPPGDGSGFLRTAVVLLPLLVVLAVVVSWQFLGNEGEGSDIAEMGASGISSKGMAGVEADFSDLIRQAQELLAEAYNVDEATAQVLAQQANDLLSEAEPLAMDEVDEAHILTLRQQAQQLLDQAGTIIRPPTVTLATVDGGSQPSMLVQGGEDLYLIDKASSTVYRVIVDPQQTVALSEIQPLLTAEETLNNGLVMGTPQFITWIPAGGNRVGDGLLILTQEGQLFDLEGDILKQSDFAVVASEGFQAVEGYGGNFYLLDPTNKQIWKYVPDMSGQYSAVPEAWMQEEGQERMGTPIDMVIDGFIFLLDQNGQVTRFQVGKPQSGFVLDPVTPPLAQPVAMAKAPPEDTDMFVADAQRVVRFDQNGRFLVEYHPPLDSDWGTIQDIAVDPDSETLYVLSNTGVHMVDVGEAWPAAE
ncbi:MAG: hypothetical protein M3220_02915 [Chloroflexota bacterium]|nr:hypothetical protein [Chloroflexota bacterium]